MPLRSDGTSEWWAIRLEHPTRTSDIIHSDPPRTVEQLRELLDAQGYSQSWSLHPLDEGHEEPGRMYGVEKR